MKKENYLSSDILDIISIWLRVQNLELNEKQIQFLDEHLNKQDNNYLKKIYEQNNKIISLLEELRNG